MVFGSFLLFVGEISYLSVMKPQPNIYQCAAHGMPRTMCPCTRNFEQQKVVAAPKPLMMQIENGLGVRFGFQNAVKGVPVLSYQGQSATMGASVGAPSSGAAGDASASAAGGASGGPSGGAGGGGASGPS